MLLSDRTFDAATLAATDVLRILRDGRPRSRAELAEQLGLARSTVSLRVEPLISSGLIAMSASSEFTGGRRAVRMGLNMDLRRVLAVDVGLTHAKVAITDLSGKILLSEDIKTRVNDGPEALLSEVISTATDLLARIGNTTSDIIAVGLGLPTPVVHEADGAGNPAQMPSWDGFDIEDWLHQSVNVPVVVDNDVNVMAVGERAGAWAGTQNFMFVKVSTGVGTSVISNGVLQRGGRNVAGHIGHVAVPRGAGIRCDCGRTGCVAAIASVPAILTALRANGVPADDSNDIINLVRSGDPVARDAVREAGCALGEILIAAVALVNPEIIAIGGSLAQVSEHLIAGIREVVYARAMPLATENLLIVPSKLGSDAGVIGASMMAVERLFSPAGVTWMLSKAA